MNWTKDDFFLKAQEFWETENNATQLDKELNLFYYRFYKKLLSEE